MAGLKFDWGGRIDAARLRFGVLAVFLVLVFLTGGGSRADIQSLVFLRPLAVFFGAWALLAMNPAQVRLLGTPLLLLLALVAIILLQLVPLPPGLWQGLPGRAAIVEIGAIAGLADIWRPLTLAPVRTLNSLFSLTVPLAVLLLVAAQGAGARRGVLVLLLVLAGVSALWGLAQLSGSPQGPLYLYRITNEGLPVGLFANRNHQAVFLACGFVIGAWYLGGVAARSRFAGLRAGLVIGAALLALGMLILTGSRAGLVLTVLAAPVALWLLARSEALRQGVRIGPAVLGARTIAGALAAIALALVGAMVALSRSVAIDRLAAMFGDRDLEGLRGTLGTILARMAADFMPFGSGFGSFEYAYRMIEPVDVMSRRYVNQAHNDLAQFAIEGGLPALVLLALFGLWLVRRSLWIWRMPGDGARRDLLLCLVLIGLVLVASVLDYPLRTPAFMAFFAALCGLIEAAFREETGRRRLAGPDG